MDSLVERSRRAVPESEVGIDPKLPSGRSWILHRNVQVLLDALTASFALLSAYALRFDFQIPDYQRRAMLIWLCVIAVLRPAVIYLSHGYKTTWRFFDLSDELNLALRAMPVTIVLLLIRAFVHSAPLIPYSILILEFGVFLGAASGLRIVRRLSHARLIRTTARPRALIVGTETTLAAAVRHLQSCGEAHVVALVSEEPGLVGLQIVGIPVLGTPAELRGLLAVQKIQLIILSGADLECARQVMDCVSDFDIPVRILPSLGDLLGGKVRVSRNVGIDQVIDRWQENKNPTHPSVVESFRGRTVLVTGAGGSIGSEISRQVSNLDIKNLIVLDHDENSIFELMNQLGRKNMQIVPIVGNIRDRDTIRRTFEQHQPEIILHAAAYKHVPVMEGNCCEAVLNNVCGTRELTEAAVEFCCESLVMISTDKAVRPSSVMGATKRVAEMVVQQRARECVGQPYQAHFSCVRFGNVLGSRGSVVPIFLRQIAAGGPVTITHEEMTRYFMTIPQAVQLVLQALTLASSGDIYMLDMGDPVKIIDFAREIIQMSGLTPGKDIEIRVVGARPGEKLHEQMWREDALVSSTPFPRVCRVKAAQVPPNFYQQVEELERLARSRASDAKIRSALQQMQIDYLASKLPEAVNTDNGHVSPASIHPIWGSVAN